MKLPKKTDAFIRTLQLLSLIAAGIGVVLFDHLEYLYFDWKPFLSGTYFVLPCLLFLGSALIHPLSPRAKRSLLLSFLAVAWFAAVQYKHRLADMGTDSLSLFSAVYLLAFPFASVAEEKANPTGLRSLGKIYIAGSLVLVLASAALLLDVVPPALSSRIFWDGTRLNALWHPNIGACLFMIAIGFTLYGLVRAGSREKQLLLVTLAAIEFCGLSLTHSRTAIVLTCGLIGGTMFFVLWKGERKRLAAAAAAAVAAMAVLFLISNGLFDFHTEAKTSQPGSSPQEQVSLTEETTQPQTTPPEVPMEETVTPSETQPPQTAPAETTCPEETDPPAVTEEEIPETEDTTGYQSHQGSYREDLWTLNNRTYIWSAAFQAVRDNPVTRIWGTKYVSAEISYRNIFPVIHAHNSWIQVMMELGIPGLLLALVYTAIALVQSFRLLFSRKAGTDKKVIALMVLCILVAGFLEPYLFVGGLSTTFANFAFFFLTGYLDDWCGKLSGKHR